MTPDERYCFEERLGMLCGAELPTVEQIAIAVKQITDQRKMNEIQKQLL